MGVIRCWPVSKIDGLDVKGHLRDLGRELVSCFSGLISLKNRLRCQVIQDLFPYSIQSNLVSPTVKDMNYITIFWA